MARFAALQPLLVGAVLLWSSYGKLFGRHREVAARRSALKRIVGEQRVVPAYRAVGMVELVLGAALLLPPFWIADVAAASVLSVGFLGYLTYARIVVPESSCGCLGSAELPVSWRSLGRAGLLLAASLTAVIAGTTAPVFGWEVLLLIGEMALFIALSPELDRYWLMPLRRLRVRMTHPLRETASSFDVPLVSTQQQLLRSPAYRSVSGLLRSDIREHWDDGEWRFLSYTASYDEGPATAVFAVPRLRYEPDAVRVAIVDEQTGETLFKQEALV
jgi:hypothetical protein